MKVQVSSRTVGVTGRLGPVCIACGNTQRFWIRSEAGELLVQLGDMVDREVRVVACGRCRSRHSVVIAHVD